ncbi:TPA: gp53-like domain-containing protein [Providencia alcalifaciens]
MKNPKLIVKPFAKNGQKNVIPENYETSMDSNQATWDQGFGQITMLPVAAGGLPPKGQDFNGILNQISENIVYQSQGGRFKFSPEYAESIGGYPKGAILQSDDEKKEYQSLIDNNKVNFNTESNISASWELVGAKYAIKAEVDLALLKKFDKENISGILGNDQSKVPSLGLLTTEVGKLQPKGNYQSAGDYATNAALTTGLAGKQPVGDYATNTELTNGLGQKLNTSSVVQSTGTSKTQVMSQDSSTKELNKKFDKSGGDVSGVVNASGNVTSNNGIVISKYGNTVLEVNARTEGQPHINVSVDGGNTWLNQLFQLKKGTLGHINRASAADSGYLICGDTGVIIQWGEVNGCSSTTDYRKFPIPFTSKCFQIITTYAAFNDFGMASSGVPIDSSNFLVTSRGSNGQILQGKVRYIAIGI